MFYTYVLRSLKDNKLYVGQTSNLKSRVKWHNEGLQTSTRHRVPLKLVYSEEFSTRNEAMARERFFKSGKGREFLNNQL